MAGNGNVSTPPRTMTSFIAVCRFKMLLSSPTQSAAPCGFDAALPASVMLALKSAFIAYPGVEGFWLAVWFLGSLFWLTYSLTEEHFDLMVYSISNVFKVRFSKLLCTWQCWDFPYKWRPPRIVLLRRWNKKILQLTTRGDLVISIDAYFLREWNLDPRRNLQRLL
jgi:hypothetical protein